MRPLGVGLVYWTELAPLFRENVAGLSVLELEPQPFWRKSLAGGCPEHIPDSAAIAAIATLPHHKLVHSVSLPLGGLNSYDGAQTAPLQDAVRRLRPEWVSEHLSFNAFQADDQKTHAAGFLLPPRQTSAGVDVAVANILRFASKVSAPVAFETGVNYLQPRSDEMTDGEFFASIAGAADCGILLDLHNLWANERNGRQSLERVLDALPADRVWEIHLAGGMMLDGYYIDGHSGAIPRALLEIAEAIVPRLPNLGAIIFEVLPSYIPQLGLDGVREQIACMAELWRRRPAQPVSIPRQLVEHAPPHRVNDDVAAWERTLASLVLGHAESADNFGLTTDGGTKILRALAEEARNNQIVRAARYTLTLLTMHLGPSAVGDLLRDYYMHSYPDLYASAEADGFMTYLAERIPKLPHVPYLIEVIRFEHALIRASLYGTPSNIDWQIDPVELFEALDAGRAPAPTRQAPFVMTISAGT